jgi:hypothetical protein
MNACGKSCMGQSACVKDCIVKREGYSDGCAQCFGDLGGCTAKNCWAKCIGGESDSCKKCVQDKCDAGFTSCSGFTPPTKQRLHAEACSGSGDPPKGPVCWMGSASVFGQTEQVLVKMYSFDSSKQHGDLDVEAGGVAGLSCDHRDFDKKGQDIVIDMNGCGSHVSIESVQYCSDSDTVDIKVKDVLEISATLDRVDPCPTA